MTAVRFQNTTSESCRSSPEAPKCPLFSVASLLRRRLVLYVAKGRYKTARAKIPISTAPAIIPPTFGLLEGLLELPELVGDGVGDAVVVGLDRIAIAQLVAC